MTTNLNPYEPSSRNAPAAAAQAHEAIARIASRLYPDPAPPSVDKAPNAEVQAVRDAHGAARQMYRDELQFGPVLEEVAQAIAPNAPADAQRTASLAAVFTDIGATRDDLAAIAAYARSYHESPPTADEEAANERAAIKDLRERYGEKFGEAFGAARALAQRDPRLTKLLNESRLGAHPAVIRRFAELGLAARARGELK
jgi:hypothetical protein